MQLRIEGQDAPGAAASCTLDCALTSTDDGVEVRGNYVRPPDIWTA